MGYYVSHMIGIRTGGVFSADTDEADVRERIAKIVTSLRGTDNDPDIGDAPHCISTELTAHKGSYIVIAGVFNYWKGAAVDAFVKALSVEFNTDVMHMEWDEVENGARHTVWTNGTNAHDSEEHPILQMVRRVGG